MVILGVGVLSSPFQNMEAVRKGEKRRGVKGSELLCSMITFAKNDISFILFLRTLYTLLTQV